MNKRPPSPERFIIVVLFAAVAVTLVSVKMVSENSAAGDMLKSRIRHGNEGAIGKMMKLMTPALQISQEEDVDSGKNVRQMLFYATCPTALYVDEYGAGETADNVEQAVPETYLEDGGEDENSASLETQDDTGTKTADSDESETALVDSEAASVSADAAQTKSNTSKSSGKNHTYSSLYTDQQLNNFSFLKETFYSIDSMTPVTAKDLNADKLLKKDVSIEKNADEPQILIYHTHGSEAFADSRKNKTQDTVIGVGDVLAEELTKTYGYNVIHDRTVYDVIDGKLDRSRAYDVAGAAVERTLKENPSIKVVIDLHRDGVSDNTRLVTTIDGKQCAKIMLFNGMSRIKGKGEIAYLKNPHRTGNLAFSLQIQLAAAEQSEGLMRRIFLRSYRYNLHYRDRSVLIEAGAQTNTVEELKNAMVPLAKALDSVLTK
jgi:stage II sporulation protein P